MTDLTGSVTTMGGSGGGNNYNDNSEGKTTPRKFNVDQDARAMESGGQYPNYWSHKTRSGHSFIMDDSQGNETVTLQHRSGTAIQMRPDGGMLITTHNGKYEVVLGEERVTISGASDITVKGDTSLRCYGDYNVTVHKDYNLTVLGNMNMTAKNVNRSVRGTIDTEAKTINTKAEGSIVHNSQDSIVQSAKNNISHTAGKMMVAASGSHMKHVAGVSDQSATMIHQNQGKTSVFDHKVAKVNLNLGTSSTQSGPEHVKYGFSIGSVMPLMNMVLTNGKVMRTITGMLQDKVTQDSSQTIGGNLITDVSENKQVQVGGSSSETVTSGNKIVTVQQGSISQVATTGSVEMRAPTGSANFVGGSTNISSLTGLLGMAGTAGVALDSLGSMLNQNGGIASIATALGLNLPFDITPPTINSDVPEIQGGSSSQPEAEPDASGEIDSWQ